MKVRITVQMHLEGVERYSHQDIDLYEGILNDYLSSHAEIESLLNINNLAGPEFKITLEGIPSNVITDILQMKMDPLDRSLLDELEELEDQCYTFEESLKRLSMKSKDQLINYMNDAEAEIIY